MTRRVVVNLAVFSVIFAVMVWWSVNNVVTIDALERPYTIHAEFEQASGILPRAEVAYLGVNYGSVDRVRRMPGKVLVTMKIGRDNRIPVGSTAHVFRKSAIGEPFVDFRPPDDLQGDDGPWIEAGETIPIERTTVPLEFSELLRSASALVRRIDPERTQTLVHELATGLHGRAASLRQLITAGETLTRTFAERTDVLDRLMTNNARLTEVIARHRSSLGQPISDLRALGESLRDARGDLALLLDHGSRFLTETADLVAARKASLDCIFQGLELVISEASTPGRIDGLRTLLQVGPRAYAQVFDARDVESDGVWVRVGTVVNPRNPPTHYVPPRSRPDVHEPVPCTSAFSDAAVAAAGGAGAGSGGAASSPGSGAAAGPRTGGIRAHGALAQSDHATGLMVLVAAVAAAGALGMWHSARSTP